LSKQAFDFFLKYGLKEKLEICTDKTQFTLFKEGMFYKCYNEDAMVFVQKVRAYKVSSTGRTACLYVVLRIRKFIK